MPRGRLDGRGPCYAYLDPASGRKQARRPGARSALIVACWALPAYLHVRYAWAQRASTSEITEQIFLIHATFHPIEIAIETAGQQYLLYSHLIDEGLRRGVRLPLAEGRQFTEEAKDQRIQEALQPLMMQGRFVIQQHHVSLKQELEDFPRGSTKDLLDAAAGCVSRMPKPQPRLAHQDSRQAIRDYLARARVPLHAQEQWERA